MISLTNATNPGASPVPVPESQLMSKASIFLLIFHISLLKITILVQLAMIARGNRQDLLVSNVRHDFQMLLLFQDFSCPCFIS